MEFLKTQLLEHGLALIEGKQSKNFYYLDNYLRLELQRQLHYFHFWPNLATGTWKQCLDWSIVCKAFIFWQTKKSLILYYLLFTV